MLRPPAGAGPENHEAPMLDHLTGDGQLLGPSSTSLDRQLDLEGYPKQESPVWAATACAIYGARLYVAAVYERHDWGQPTDLAEALRYYVLTARRLVPPLEGRLVLARGRGLLPGAPALLGRAYTSAHAACADFGERVLREFLYAADLTWHYPAPVEDREEWEGVTADPPTTGMSDREAWDAVHHDLEVINLATLPYHWARDNVRDHLLGLRLPDPAGLMAQVRIEALFIQEATRPAPVTITATPAGAGKDIAPPPEANAAPWDEKALEEEQRVVRRLLRFMRDVPEASLETVCSAVWEKRYEDVSDDAISAAVYKANLFLRRQPACKRSLSKLRDESVLRWG
jgi:hypothetical protein